MAVDRCRYCGHAWHGLPCAATILTPCACSSAHPEFRVEPEDPCDVVHEATGAKCFRQRDNHTLTHHAWAAGQQVTWPIEQFAQQLGRA